MVGFRSRRCLAILAFHGTALLFVNLEGSHQTAVFTPRGAAEGADAGELARRSTLTNVGTGPLRQRSGELVDQDVQGAPYDPAYAGSSGVPGGVPVIVYEYDTQGIPAVPVIVENSEGKRRSSRAAGSKSHGRGKKELTKKFLLGLAAAAAAVVAAYMGYKLVSQHRQQRQESRRRRGRGRDSTSSGTGRWKRVRVSIGGNRFSAAHFSSGDGNIVIQAGEFSLRVNRG